MARGPHLVGRDIEGIGMSGIGARECEEGCAGAAGSILLNSPIAAMKR